MSQFTTITSTYVNGGQQDAWDLFREGGYVAIGWADVGDLTGKSPDEIRELIRREYPDEKDAYPSFEKFLSLKPGDYVAVKNVNFGLFGIGIIQSGYKFDPRKHPAGDADDPDYCFPHYRDVKWVRTEFMPRRSLIAEGETSWPPYRTIGKVLKELPPYICRVLEISPASDAKKIAFVRPPDLKNVIDAVEALRKETEHKERAHESLVEEFFVALGYSKHKDIKYRQGRVDIRIEQCGRSLILAEVKASWELSLANNDGIHAREQAYAYAHEEGVRFVIVTNGDTYFLFDRLKGLSWESNFLANSGSPLLQKRIWQLSTGSALHG